MKEACGRGASRRWVFVSTHLAGPAALRLDSAEDLSENLVTKCRLRGPNPRGFASVNWDGSKSAFSVRSTDGSVVRAAVNHTLGTPLLRVHTKALPSL